MRLASAGAVHLFTVAVVGGNKQHATGLAHRPFQTAQADIDAFGGLDGGRQDTGMANHVAVGVVDDNQIETVFADSRDQFVRYLGGRHFGCQVIGGDLRRRDQGPFLTRENRLQAAVEEKSDMGVFFGLGDPQLAHARVGHHFSQYVFEFQGRE